MGERVGLGPERARPTALHLADRAPFSEEPDLPRHRPLLLMATSGVRRGCGGKPVEAGRKRNAVHKTRRSTGAAAACRPQHRACTR
jgi:hypothetical protein